MKKLAIGCAALLVLCVLGVTVAGVFIYWKVRSAAQGIAQIAEIQKLDNNLANKSSFSAPANGELTEEAVRRFVAVQESMSAKLGSKMKELDAKVEELKSRQRAEHRDASFSEAIGMFNDVMGLLVQAKTVWVDALNQSHFSKQEYAWVRTQVYTAANMPIAPVDLEDLPNAIKNGQRLSSRMQQKSEAEMDADVPPRNRALVKPYADKLKDWMPFAFFGM
jgi:hypothetical protein